MELYTESSITTQTTHKDQASMNQYLFILIFVFSTSHAMSCGTAGECFQKSLFALESATEAYEEACQKCDRPPTTYFTGIPTQEPWPTQSIPATTHTNLKLFSVEFNVTSPKELFLLTTSYRFGLNPSASSIWLLLRVYNESNINIWEQAIRVEPGVMEYLFGTGSVIIPMPAADKYPVKRRAMLSFYAGQPTTVSIVLYNHIAVTPLTNGLL